MPDGPAAHAGNGADILTVSGLNVSYGESKVLFDVSLSVKPNQVVACVGRNGAGKTTLLRSIAGFLRPASGSVMCGGLSLVGRMSYEIARLGIKYVPQDKKVFSDLTVRENLELGSHATHPGADDNASGVAALDELARAFAQGPSPDRTILFVAFDGEEAGRLGSKRLLEDLKRDGLDIRAMINLDKVGRLGNRKVLVLGTGTATEWVHVVRGAGFVTGVPVESSRTIPEEAIR